MGRLAISVALLLSVLLAQEAPPSRVEVRLLEMLRENGVITDAQHLELKRVADEMRAEEEDWRRKVVSDAEGEKLSSEIDRKIEKLNESAGLLTHRAGRGFRFQSEDERFSLDLSGRIQIRFTYNFWDENPETNDEREPSFAVQRARLGLRGHVFTKKLRYRIGVDFAGDEATTTVRFLNIVDEFSSSNRLAELKDAYVEYAVDEAFRIRAGQFKVPYSRHFMTGNDELEFVERSVTDGVFAPSRDSGLQLWGGLFGEDDDVLVWYAGIFNGEGENFANDDKGLLYAGRLELSPFGAISDGEGDIESLSEFGFTLGVNARLHQDDNHLGNGDVWFLGADLGVKWQGLFLLFEIHHGVADQFPGNDESAVGWFGQVGYMLVAARLELALRHGEVTWDDSGDRNSGRRETLGSLNYFFEGHKMKIQTSFGWVENHEGDHNDNREGWSWLMQFQVSF